MIDAEKKDGKVVLNVEDAKGEGKKEQVSVISSQSLPSH